MFILKFRPKKSEDSKIRKCTTDIAKVKVKLTSQSLSEARLRKRKIQQFTLNFEAPQIIYPDSRILALTKAFKWIVNNSERRSFSGLFRQTTFFTKHTAFVGYLDPEEHSH